MSPPKPCLRPTRRLRPASLALAFVVAVLAGCANPALRDADALRRQGRHADALALLDTALQARPADAALRAAAQREREAAVAQWLVQAEQAHASGRDDVCAQLLDRVEALQPQHPRAVWLRRDITRSARRQQVLAEARADIAQRRYDTAETRLRELGSDAPNDPATRALLQQLADRGRADAAPMNGTGGELASAYQKPVSLEFRDAPLRAVFEAMSRAAGANFVFDKDVRGDAKVTIFLRKVSVDEAMRVILSTQGLDRKVLNENSVLIYPNTPQKQREHQELVTRSIYLANADVKQALALVKTMTKTRDLFTDERLNLLVVRDTPEVVRLVERLVESIDIVEPEVMLDVEVLEVATSTIDQLGLGWPETVAYGLPDAAGQLTAPQALLGSARGFRGVVANPALVATLKGVDANARLLANPRIRARNREKAKIQIGDKLPVFSTTAAGLTGGASTTVTYLDVGLKVDVEPTVQLDNDVVIKVALEVSNLVKQVNGPNGSLAYQVGTRQTTTSLRLRDGETQVISGLINDEDRRTANGVPGLSRLPVLGALFGVQGTERSQTEVVLLITPRVLRNLALPGSALGMLASGTDAAPGNAALRLRSGSEAGVSAGGGAGNAMARSAAPPPPDSDAGMALAAAAASAAGNAGAGAAVNADVVQLNVATTAEVKAGATFSVTLSHTSNATVSGELEFDPQRFQSAGARAAGAGADGSVLPPGRVPFELTPQGQRAIVLRALAGGEPGPASLNLQGLRATAADGRALDVRPSAEARITVLPR